MATRTQSSRALPRMLAVFLGVLLTASAVTEAAACLARSGDRIVNNCGYKVRIAYSTQFGMCSNRYPAPSGCGKTLEPGESERVSGHGKLNYKICPYDAWRRNRCSLAR